MIIFKNVSKIYKPNLFALKDINLTIKTGSFTSIVGSSGAGKTTLLKLIIGEEKPSKGAVYFQDQDIGKLRSGKLPFLRRRIGMIFQDFKLLPSKITYENVAFAMEAAGRSDSEIERDVGQILELVGLSGKEKHFPKELSGGEQQRVAVARALSNRPDVLIADEPTGNLDPYNSDELIKLLLKINEIGTTVLFASHAKEIINKLKRRVITMQNGEIIKDEERGRYEL